MTLEEWKRIAEAATSGPWSVDNDPRDGMEWNRHIMADANNAVCFMAHSDGLDDERDAATAAHIAASHPARVLAALKVIEAAKAMRLTEARTEDYRLVADARIAFDDALAELEALE